MKIHKLITTSVFVGLLVAGSAQAAVIFNSIGNTGGTASTTTQTFGKAINFVIGSGTDYTLNSVVLNFGTVTAGAAPVVTIWANEAGTTPIAGPSALETLTISGTPSVGLNTFTSTGLTLEADTTYWLVLRGANANSISWVADAASTNAPTIGSNTDRVFGGGGSAPNTWSSTSGQLNGATINATAVPEPSSSIMLVGFGVMSLLIRRRA